MSHAHRYARFLRRLILLCSFACLLSAVGACKDKGTQRADSGKGAIDKNELCQSGGATFDSASGECVCSYGHRWDGSRCEADATQATPTPRPGSDSDDDNDDDDDDDDREERKDDCEDSGGDWDADDRSCDCPSGKRLDNGRCRASSSSKYDATKVKAACESAGGHWYSSEPYCYCDDDEVLVGDSCKTLNGRVTKSVCAEAVYPGEWDDGRCTCPEAPDDERWVFSPARGGCAPAAEAGETMLRRVCESSVNNGKWDSYNDRCKCPSTRLWDGELCVVQEDLSSEEVCESDFNQGTWSSARKSCICKLGFLWMDQECQPILSVSYEEACEAEVNGGTWSSALNTCICPGHKKKWSPALKSCKNGNLTGAQQLCMQSGGQPAPSVGKCTCGNGLKVQTLSPQNYQYCVQENANDIIPKWLLNLLGILTQ